MILDAPSLEDTCDDWSRRDLVLWAERHQLNHVALTAFAYQAAALLDRGLAYRSGVDAGREPLELARHLNRPIRTLQRMADLADAYGEVEGEELKEAAFLAASRELVTWRTFNACLESEPLLLRALGPSGEFACCLLEWRKLRGASPPLEYVAYCLAGDWGQYTDKHGAPEIACHLAAAFPEEQLSMAQAEEVVSRHCMQLMTPALARSIAADAISQCAPAACANPSAAGTPANAGSAESPAASSHSNAGSPT